MRVSSFLLTGMFLLFSVLTASAVGTVPDWSQVQLGGYDGVRIANCIARCVKGSDVKRMTAIYHQQNEDRLWQGEFWGKWMHSAVPFAVQTGDQDLRRMIVDSAREVMDAQLPNGYIGNYSESSQVKRGTWDVWGRKYTLLGLILYYDYTGDRRALDCCARLVDHLMKQVGPGGISLVETGCHRGMASCSILESLVGLWNRTKDDKYFKAAEYVISEMCENPNGPLLVKRADRDVADRFAVSERGDPKYGSDAKAYEMLSCYQGIYEWYQVTGDRKYLDACVKTANNIIDTEINILGGSAILEMWAHCKECEVKPWLGPMETCVTTTWMRFLEMLISETGDPRYADELERSWLNAFSGAMKDGGETWTQYCPLDGYRGPGNIQCGMGTSCCIQNGPRGYLAVMRSLVMGREDGVDVNLFANSKSTVKAAGGRVTIVQETDYPIGGKVAIKVTCEGTASEWTLRLREPGWTAIDGRATWRKVRRVWKSGDTYEFVIPLAPRVIAKDSHVAILRGPLALARSGRFEDGDVDATLAYAFDEKCPLRLQPVKVDWARCAFDVAMPFGVYTGDKKNRGVRAVRICDWASAGNEWSPRAAARVWLPVSYNPFGGRAE